MKIQWLFLLLALVLLLPPLPFSAALQKCLHSSRRRTFVTPSAAARVWQNWADLVRAAVGTYLLTESITADPNRVNAELSEVMVEASLLAVAVLVQTVRVMRSIKILAPVFYLGGMTLVLGGWLQPQGAFAVGASWLFALAGKNMAYQLPAMAAALLLASLVLGLELLAVVNCGLILLPIILSTLLKKRLVVAACSPSPA